MSGITRLLFVSAAVAIGLLALSWAPSASAAIDEPLKIGNECDFPPFSKRDPSGECSGFDIDVINFVCAQIGVQCEIVVQEWSGIIPGLMAGKYRAIISSMDINDERKKKLLFTKPYYHAKYSFVAKKGALSGVEPADLAGKTVCMFKNTSPIDWFKKNYPETKINFYDGAEDIKFDLIADRCQAWLETTPSIYGTIFDSPEGDQFELVGPQFDDPCCFGQGVGMSMKLGDTELADRLNAAIDALYATGTFDKIEHKYFPDNIDLRAQ
jgi:lysine-arginine-ornithine-binding protein